MAHIITISGMLPAVDLSAFVAPTATLSGDVALAADSSAFYGVSVRGDTAPIRSANAATCRTTWSCTPTRFPLHGRRRRQRRPRRRDPRVHRRGQLPDRHERHDHERCRRGRGFAGRRRRRGAGGDADSPRSLVAGVPAKVRRELTEEEYQSVLDNASRYVELAALHRDAIDDASEQ